jgi:hypothetical protein
MHHLLEHSINLHLVHRIYSVVWYNIQSKELFFLNSINYLIVVMETY